MPQSFNVQEDPVTVFKRAMEGRFDPSALRASRESRLREMERSLELEQDSRQAGADRQRERALQSPSDRRRDEMMGWGRSPTFTSGATHADVRHLQQDLDEDPDTGVLAQDRTQRIARTLENAATTQREEVGDAVDVGSRRNAFAKFLEAQGIAGGKFAADVSPEGTEALDAASGRKQRELGIAPTARRGINGGIPLVALKSGDDPLDGLDPREQAIIKGLTEYKVQLPGGAALRTAEWQDRLGRALLLDPSFDQTQYTARQKMRSDKGFQDNVQALGTVQKHADALHEKGKLLDNFGRLGPLNETANEFKNWWKKQSGDPTVSGYALDQTAVGDEIARALKGGVATQAEGEHWRAQLRDALSPQAQEEVHRTIADLVQKRLAEAGQRYDSVMGKPGAFKGYLEDTQAHAGQTAAGEVTPERKVFTSGPYRGRTGIKQPDGTWEVQ